MNAPASDGEVLRVVSWNIEHNGIPIGGQPDRRARARAVLAAHRPHIVLRQEVRGPKGTFESALTELETEAAALGLEIAVLAPGTDESPNATAVLVDPELFEVEHRYVHTTGMWHPIANPVVRLRGTSKPLGLASAHLCSWDPAWREREAQRLLVLADKGRSALIGMDGNSYPHTAMERHRLPDWRMVADTAHARRFTIWEGGR
ncbi:endonuclease/exonuclease/phosphatase family protein [Streptomyces sp. NBRC 109706]|uniref:endonuclease/exonuclease/phosphatase family protein n=1 Tax=Streptomyces sp. NBRC 109706 TaxID=1550035 RepID=UPI000782125B|nr:endonuclease/exonuclease/phosphatase family protein [Streptomyces sp. NBRC 109706]